MVPNNQILGPSISSSLGGGNQPLGKLCYKKKKKGLVGRGLITIKKQNKTKQKTKTKTKQKQKQKQKRKTKNKTKQNKTKQNKKKTL